MNDPDRRPRAVGSDGRVPREAVREATEADGARIRQLADELRATVMAQRGGAQLMVDAAGAGMTSVDPAPAGSGVAETGSRVLVGCLDDVVVGFATCRVDDVRQPPVGLLGACYVEPDARGVGVGHLLLEAALGWLAERGCPSVDGPALPGDRRAKNFYESAGFKARLLTMHRPTP
jgi:GNAT superfamily N-acetyltransferase